MTPNRGVPVWLLVALLAGMLIGAGPAQGQGGTAYVVTYNNIWQEYDEVWAYIGTGLWFDWWCPYYEGGCVAFYYAYVQGTLERDSNGVDWSSGQMWNYPAGAWLSAEIPPGLHSFYAFSSHHVDYLWFNYYECWLGCGLYSEAFDYSEQIYASGGCAYPTNFHMTSAEPAVGGALHFTYAWESSTGNPQDLAGGACQFREYVSYENGGYPPSPPFPPVAFANPTTEELQAGPITGYEDYQWAPGPPAQFRTPYSEAHFYGWQSY